MAFKFNPFTGKFDYYQLSGGGTGNYGSIITTVNTGDDQNYTLASALTSTNFYIIMNQGYYLPTDTDFPYSITGLTLTFNSPLPADLANKQITVICV